MFAFADAGRGQELTRKFCGRVPILALNPGVLNPATLTPDNEDCTNNLDDDADGSVDYADQDCQGKIGPQVVFLKLPFDAIQPVGAFAPAWYTATDKTGEQGGELLINSTGPGGRKLSYLRTDGRDSYSSVHVRAAIVPGATGDEGGPIAIRIQGPEAGPKAGKSYYVRTVPGNTVSLRKDNGDGTSSELASATKWANGDAIDIPDYSDGDAVCFAVDITALGDSLTAKVWQVDCLGVLLNNYDTVSGHEVTLTANDGELQEGFVGVRSDNDAGGDVVDDAISKSEDPSVIDYWISDPSDDAPHGPRIAFFNSYSANFDANLDYTTDPITPRDNNLYNRALGALADATLASYLRSLGFQVDEYHISSFALGLLTPDVINANYDLFWLPSSGASSDTKTFVRAITIPFLFAEHVDGAAEFAGVWAGTGGQFSGNENQQACPDTTTKSISHVRVVSEDQGGNPNHPIVRGLGDAEGNVLVHDVNDVPLNSLYPVPGSGPAGSSLSGKPFKGIKETLDERGWGSGHPETQFGGYPLAEGATALLATVNPCTDDTFFQVDVDGNLTSADGKGHLSLIAVESETPRLATDPALCPDPDACLFDSRVVFYWLSDRAFPFATKDTLRIVRRSALWALHLLDSENRSDTPFQRSDSNGDGKIDLSDAVFSLNWLFGGGAEPSCLDAADSNDDEKVDISDSVYTLSYLFLGGPGPAPPFNNCFMGCGLDFTPAGPPNGVEDPAAILSCKSYAGCRS